MKNPIFVDIEKSLYCQLAYSVLFLLQFLEDQKKNMCIENCSLSWNAFIVIIYETLT